MFITTTWRIRMLSSNLNNQTNEAKSSFFVKIPIWGPIVLWIQSSVILLVSEDFSFFCIHNERLRGKLTGLLFLQLLRGILIKKNKPWKFLGCECKAEKGFCSWNPWKIPWGNTGLNILTSCTCLGNITTGLSETCCYTEYVCHRSGQSRQATGAREGPARADRGNWGYLGSQTGSREKIVISGQFDKPEIRSETNCTNDNNSAHLDIRVSNCGSWSWGWGICTVHEQTFINHDRFDTSMPQLVSSFFC